MVIGYLRVSTDHQHLENQEDEIMRYVRAKNLVVERWVREVASGATLPKDRQLGRQIRLLKKGDVLIVTEISRLSRSLHEIMQIMKTCVDTGVVVHSTKDGYVFDDSINSKVLSFAFGLSAEIEHKLISQRTREAMAHGKSKGRHMGRNAGSGQKMNLLIAHTQEIQEKLEAGRSMMDICREYEVSYATFRRFWLELNKTENP